ncbi:TPA: helix-turn-helix domain-containing protein [Clostridioides difficile]|mgnify:CR=1 FL=1|uniref:Helix-turn-helix domain-containing protein n=1 Tax=Clostridioides difficile TaxID=1496 RepID=A0A9P3YS79_CLODI|nr:helix-turn-helix domain-containing protein [Clostridioides difficile]HDN2472795.1 helix-turn-helix domain-containing protein [Clostridioides difficile CD196]ELX4528802.1 helix-turn-helix domain-containing protein [Clostridioides difficile]ELX4557448.1 helix-turn-helix domain-containing protein [Clostridioides difficile]MBF8988733.1 helix-turn-helix domain-containing protein [Clostridioides difficile]MBH7209735.1 helix-turn-helix domain-containing protein [Clostridioides difficile]
MLYERLEKICKQNNITISALCKEITGSTGNLSTWKKNNIKSEYLANICIKFNISADYLLFGEQQNSNTKTLFSENEKEILSLLHKFNERNQIKFISKVEDLADKMLEKENNTD